MVALNEKLAFVFPGSGSQYSGMASQQYKDSSIIRRTFEEADEVLKYRISDIILDGSTIKLNRINNMFLAIYVVSVAYFRRYLEEDGVFPVYMAGHSLGEYSALTCSGAISFESGLEIVKSRSQLAENVTKHTDASMTIIKNVSPELVKNLCDKAQRDGYNVSIACYNSPSQVSISGDDRSLRIIEQSVLKSDSNVQAINLLGSAPYHCELMRPCAAVLEEKLKKCSWNKGKCKVISNVTGFPYTSVEEAVNLLSRQLYQPVQWQRIVQYFLNEKINTIVEVGPQNVLKNLIFENTDKIRTYAYDECLDREYINRVLKDTKKKSTSDKDKVRVKVITMCIMHASSLRNYNTNPDFDNTRSRELYEKVKVLKKQIESNEVDVCDEHVDIALKMLEAVFETKLTPINERQTRFKMIKEKAN
jgi:[acyl-carrier-protein] S-malonyltransferase